MDYTLDYTIDYTIAYTIDYTIVYSALLGQIDNVGSINPARITRCE